MNFMTAGIVKEAIREVIGSFILMQCNGYEQHRFECTVENLINFNRLSYINSKLKLIDLYIMKN